MAIGEIVASITIGATLGAGFNRAFQDAKGRMKVLGETYEEANKRLLAAGNVLKYKRQLDTLRSKQGDLTEAEKKALAAAEKGSSPLARGTRKRRTAR